MKGRRGFSAETGGSSRQTIARRETQVARVRFDVRRLCSSRKIYDTPSATKNLTRAFESHAASPSSGDGLKTAILQTNYCKQTRGIASHGYGSLPSGRLAVPLIPPEPKAISPWLRPDSLARHPIHALSSKDDLPWEYYQSQLAIALLGLDLAE